MCQFILMIALRAHDLRIKALTAQTVRLTREYTLYVYCTPEESNAFELCAKGVHSLSVELDCWVIDMVYRLIYECVRGEHAK